ncbi:putative iron-siderophore ABC transporter permease protein [Austwickia chelonae NBRC 105200]|uniref:Putative iron-siderophore ABC transporter permease protein n=1 Tax=Austwickia chelonae NBRC 105200 TaxID=1184607 RepID=K6UNG7_9MICO|nr:putative iron-siderophore ABC transporter permease protein [Austwickia chelonae NBRC 105200]
MLLLALMVASLMFGSTKVPVEAIYAGLRHPDLSDPDQLVIATLRWPRTVVAVVAGVALGVAGVLMQALTRNPLAEPGILGVNSGAAAGVVATMTFLPALDVRGQLAAAFVGAAVAGGIVLVGGGVFTHDSDPVRLVLAGVATAAVLGSFSSFLVISNPQVFQSFRHWDAGAVNARPWPLIVAGAVLIAAASVLAVALASSLDALALGTEAGKAVGAHPGRTWAGSGLAVVVLAGTATALTGPVVLLGLLAPVAARAWLGPSVVRLLPVAALIGPVVLLFADIVGRLVIPPAEVHASVVCAAMGAVVFVAIARRGRLRG